jgi:hypothetical protein
MRVLQGPQALKDRLFEIEDTGAKLERTLVEVKRTGQGFDTRYAVRVIRPLTAPELEEITKAQLIDLSTVDWVGEMLAEQNGDALPF